MEKLLNHCRCLGRAMLDFVYPPRCLFCDCDLNSRMFVNSNAGIERLSLEDRIQLELAQDFCEGCLSKFTSPQRNRCKRCGAPLGPYSNSSAKCLVCSRESYAFDAVIRLGLYRDEMRLACLMAKNPGGALIARSLTDLLVATEIQELHNTSPDMVIPVPEHWLKRLVRPQYAAETISRQISTRLKLRLSTDILRKPRWTPKQAKSSPSDRRKQQQGSFAVRNGIRLDGKTVLLVDDILTTGATAHEAARMLKRAGAKSVVVAVLAVSPP